MKTSTRHTCTRDCQTINCHPRLVVHWPSSVGLSLSVLLSKLTSLGLGQTLSKALLCISVLLVGVRENVCNNSKNVVIFLDFEKNVKT